VSSRRVLCKRPGLAKVLRPLSEVQVEVEVRCSNFEILCHPCKFSILFCTSRRTFNSLIWCQPRILCKISSFLV